MIAMASLASSSPKSSGFHLGTCLVLLLSAVAASTQLSSTFYDETCPDALSTIRHGVKDAVAQEPRMGASLLRLHFHDCFVNGCDGSVLLDDKSTFTGEKTAFPNRNSVRGFDVIDNIKSDLESICPGVVSCADILAVAARDSVVKLGGPSWTVQLGRRDSLTASLSAANSNLPSPFSSLRSLISLFYNKGLSTTDMVALSGAHTIGLASCKKFRSRIYNETNIDSSFAALRQENCPSASGSGDNNLAPLDKTTHSVFDNAYFQNLLHYKGLLHSDQELYGYHRCTDSIVQDYSDNSSTFFTDFADAMIKMGNLSPLAGCDGEIRTNCRRANY